MPGLQETEALAKFVCELSIDDVPQEVRHHTKLVILDTVGNAYGGYRTDVGRIVDEMTTYNQNGSGATVLGPGCRAPVADAIYANARLANVLDADETHFSIEHLANTAVTVPLAICESQRLEGPELLEAVIAGYEVGQRISPPLIHAGENGSPTRAIGRDGGTAKGFGLGNTYAATASAAKALGLTVEETKHAFGIAGERVPDRTHIRNWDDDLPLIKYQQVGACGRAGYEAAVAARVGDTGVPDLLDGDDGIWAAFAPVTSNHKKIRERALESLNKRWVIRESVLKEWPCCHFNQFPLRDIYRLLEENQVSLDEIEHVIQYSPPFFTSPKFTEQQPQGIVAAQFSAPHVLAMVLTETSVYRWYTPETLADPKIRTLRNSITVEEDQTKSVVVEGDTIREIEFTVEIETGSTAYTVESSMVSGMPWYNEEALSQQQLIAKFVENTKHPYTDSNQWKRQMEQVSSDLLSLEERDVGTVMNAFGRTE